MPISPRSQRAGLETQLKQAQDKLQQAQQNADLASTSGRAWKLNSSRPRINCNRPAECGSGHQPTGRFETQLKQAQDKLQQAQQNADLAISQRAAWKPNSNKPGQAAAGAAEC